MTIWKPITLWHKKQRGAEMRAAIEAQQLGASAAAAGPIDACCQRLMSQALCTYPPPPPLAPTPSGARTCRACSANSMGYSTHSWPVEALVSPPTTSMALLLPRAMRVYMRRRW